MSKKTGSSIQAVILAGGLGSRLMPLTETMPKVMAPVRGRPYLWYQLTLLVKQGITDILLLTGYQAEQIESFFGTGKTIGAQIAYSREPSPRGTGGALRLAAPLLSETFLLCYGDSYLPIDYRACYRSFLNGPMAQGMLVVYDNRAAASGVHGNIALDQQGRVIRYCKDDPGGTCPYVDAGVAVYRKDILSFFPPEREVLSLETDVFPPVAAAGELRAFMTAERFYDIGDSDRLALFEDYVARHVPGTIHGPV